ncbi:MAG: glycosidase [Acidobacteria bacterium]|nr:glycosidase [Acidobacteriota bacterium]
MPPAESGLPSTLFQRHPGNPILTARYWPYPVNSVFNAGAVRLETGGETLLLVRCEDHRGHSHLTAARSKDGAGGWEIDPSPTFSGDPQSHSEELWGVEDPRITWAPELGRYAVVYVAYGRGGPGVSLALTEDFREFERIGMVLPPEDKDAALFPRRFGGRWALIHRPVPNHGSADMWISYSPDLTHWGDHRVLIQARRGGWWDAGKIGLCPQPIETRDGWLLLYHGVRETAAGALYRVGLALLDLESPERVLRRSDEWVFGPQVEYEHVGDVADVVFPCGATVDPDGDTLFLYYGGADTVMCLATASLEALLTWLKDHGRPGGVARDE